MDTSEKLSQSVVMETRYDFNNFKKEQKPSHQFFGHKKYIVNSVFAVDHWLLFSWVDKIITHLHTHAYNMHKYVYQMKAKNTENKGTFCMG